MPEQGINLGDAVLYFRGDMAGLQSAATQAGNVVNGVIGQANQAQEGFMTQGRVMWGSITAGIAAGTEALARFTEGAEQAERIDAQLEAVIKSTGGTAGMTKESIRDLAMAIREKTAIDDDSIAAGEAMLLTFTNIGKDVFPMATQAATDMATAMNSGAEPSAEQMKNQSIMLGKALNDPTQGLTALTRVGVTFTEEQKNQIKAMQESGDVAGAQKVILAELNKEFGGSAAARMETSAGQMRSWSLAVDDATDAVGELLLPISPLIDGVGKVGLAVSGAATLFGGFGNMIKGIGGQLGLIGSSAGAASTALTGASTASAALTASMGGMAASFGAAALAAAPFILAIGAAGIAIYSLYDAAKNASVATKEKEEADKGLEAQLSKLLVVASQRNIQIDQESMKQMNLGDKMEYVRQAIERDISAKQEQANQVQEAEQRKQLAYRQSDEAMQNQMQTEAQQMASWWDNYDQAMRGQGQWVIDTENNLVKVAETGVSTVANMASGLDETINQFVGNTKMTIDEYTKALSAFFDAMFSGDAEVQRLTNEAVNNSVSGMSQNATIGTPTTSTGSSSSGSTSTVNVNVDNLTVNNGGSADDVLNQLTDALQNALVSTGYSPGVA